MEKSTLASISDAARELKLSRQAVWRLVKDGKLSGWQVGEKSWVLSRSSLDTYKKTRNQRLLALLEEIKTQLLEETK
jgi:excisionase family DNA binding protein